ncbi:MAG: Propionyl-CoA carboxylase beta chain [Alphaproteobacteria bacterium MarineAlpha4_Bin2]|nr:MAG: Propionyl-CoA carboxylase beta chain [Alphaproteobacteria bacterium MarineAlpha4_Bin2]
MAFDELYDEYERRRVKALAMGGPERLEKRRNAGLLNARERIDYLVDKGSWVESGLFTVSHIEGDRESTPGDGKITGYGAIDDREAVIISNDFTVKGASSSVVNMRRIGQMRRTATERGIPMVFLGESSGARIPDNMGAYNMGAILAGDGTQYRRLREQPWASAVLGMAYGSATWYGCLSDFNVMRKGAVMAVSSERLVSMAIGEKVDGQDLGGWRMHTDTTGLVDLAVDTDEEALDAIKTFLSYLPENQNQMPPEKPVPAGSDEIARSVLDVLPVKRTQVYDIRKIIERIADKESVFELKARFGRTATTALARLGGQTVGFVANNPMFKAGALDADGCDKSCSFLVLCDSFNIPVIFLVDNPGFVIGIDAERQRAPGKIMNFMNALQLMTVPKLTVMIRKNYGQAYINMGGGKNAAEVAAWPTAEVSFMDPAFAVNVVHGKPGERLEEADPEFFERKFAEFQLESSVYDIAASYGVQHIIKPEDTREWLVRMLKVHRNRLSGNLSQHLLSNWPTTF